VTAEIGYCTNVHASDSIDSLIANLREHAVGARRRLGSNRPLGVGLWLPDSAVTRALADRDTILSLREFLDGEGLVPFTMNGFPYGDFHRGIVKHDVYFPTWWDPRRADYTLRLFELLDALLPPRTAAAVSTLPIAWGDPPPTDDEWRAAADQLARVARRLAEIEQASGRRFLVALEPEPGCALEKSSDVAAFFDRYLRPIDRGLVDRHIGVCHDICHAAVVFARQDEALETYRTAGIRIGKVQVSSAVFARLDAPDPELRASVLAQLAAFSEMRYLHQTAVRYAQGSSRFFEDLPLALGYHAGREPPRGEWRVHFHVPIHVERFGRLDTSRNDIERCVRLCLDGGLASQFEIETYAWNVVPDGLRAERLCDGIAAEIAWLTSRIAEACDSRAGE